jgi:hypothetical protein
MRVAQSTEDGRPKTVDGQRQRQSRCLRLFPDPQPLVERLGRDFFRQLPESPGVYLMCDGAGVVLYVGKAKNLRKRLNGYRVANSDRMARRHLRLLRAVARIELQACADERAALMTEADRNLTAQVHGLPLHASSRGDVAMTRYT